MLKRHNVKLATYVPDNVLRPLIEAIEADPFFTAFACTREEEALGINAGAWMGGLRGILLMQTSGFATLANVHRVAIGAVPDPNADDGVRARDVGRIQHRPVAGGPDNASGPGCAVHRDPHDDPAGRGGVHPGPEPGPGRCNDGASLFILSPLLTGGKVFAK